MYYFAGMLTRHQPSRPRPRPRHQTSRPKPRQHTEQNNQVINWHFSMSRPTSTLFEWIVSLTHYKPNTFKVYSHCNAPQHQSTACTIQFFDTLLNIQLFSHSVATTTQVHQHFKQGISHSDTIWPHDETSQGKHALNWCRCSRNTCLLACLW